MKIGYARVSTEDQKLDLQLTALRDAGCDEIFKDHGFSGSVMSRPGLERLLRVLKPGQTLVVWRLDRLGRSLTGLVQVIDELGKRGVEFQSLTEEVNTTSSGGRLVFHIMAALAEFERTLISERTKAGMMEAQRNGRHIGRPPMLSTEELLEASRCLKNESLQAVATRYGVSPRTLRRHIKKHEETRCPATVLDG
ncbi:MULTISPECIES: recombinase family protein [Paracoccus]|jgi:DNA invertase Pin-like site-specific DNA recombinase|uniref:recombinase family protein n=1 Tax=Paracoccus TaxID=265 RepID=UPI000CEC429A|nr:MULTISPECIES: recombinase family protein [Paracoccus]